MQEEVTQKVIALSIKAAKLDAAVLQKALKIALEQIKKQHFIPAQKFSKSKGNRIRMMTSYKQKAYNLYNKHTDYKNS